MVEKTENILLTEVFIVHAISGHRVTIKYYLPVNNRILPLYYMVENVEKIYQ